ncbi:MAG: glutamine synthetase family protein [Nocardioidaceae bacterium]
MDVDERNERSVRAESIVSALEKRGVVAFATSFVDNSGISRVKTVPLGRLPQLAAWGVGFSTAFDYFRFDDWVAAPAGGEGPVGDQRIIPDLSRVVVLAAQPGWAWAPGERWSQQGEEHDKCSRLLLRRQTEALAQQGITVQSAFEVEWVVSRGDSDDFAPATSGSGYGLSRLVEVSDYARDVMTAMTEQGVVVEQFHPEYAAGQFELTVAPESPVAAADTSVLVRTTLRAIGEVYGFRTSFSPKVDTFGVGNGGHVHLSLWRDGQNLMAGGERAFELTGAGEAFSAGVLEHLPALLAVGAPGVASYLRLVPSHWAGAYACWGLENRETALRMVTGSTGSSSWAANMEVKCFDLLANPYLALAGLLAAGSAGLAGDAVLPEPVDVDPAALTQEVRDERGIELLPDSLRESVTLFAADDTLRAAFGQPLVDAIVAVRESEIELFDGATPEEIAAATRWTH